MLNIFTHPKSKSFIVTTGLAILAIISYLFDSQVATFDFYRSAILQGELWRVLTGHVFHTNGFHLLLNLAGLLLLTLLHRQFYQPVVISILVVFTMIFISLALLIQAELTHYVGLSGVLHGLFAFGACKDIENNEKTGIFLLLGLWLKVVYEQLQGPSEEIAALINANVAIDAHLWGALAGSLFFIMVRLLNRSRLAPHSTSQ